MMRALFKYITHNMYPFPDHSNLCETYTANTVLNYMMKTLVKYIAYNLYLLLRIQMTDHQETQITCSSYFWILIEYDGNIS